MFLCELPASQYGWHRCLNIWIYIRLFTNLLYNMERTAVATPNKKALYIGDERLCLWALTVYMKQRMSSANVQILRLRIGGGDCTNDMTGKCPPPYPLWRTLVDSSHRGLGMRGLIFSLKLISTNCLTNSLFANLRCHDGHSTSMWWLFLLIEN